MMFNWLNETSLLNERHAQCGHAPPLRNGDQMLRSEFERRYDATPALKKAELVKGVVYLGAPVKQRLHAVPHAHLVGLLGVYATYTQGADAGDNGSLRVDKENMPQPDAFLRLSAQCGGQCYVDEDDYVAGLPELIAEVTDANSPHDLTDKQDIYEQHGVCEYLVWRTEDSAFDWLRRDNHSFIRVEPNTDGIIESSVFPGLRLNIPALLAGDMATVLAELQRGIASPAHAAFVEQLAQRKQQLTTDN